MFISLCRLFAVSWLNSTFCARLYLDHSNQQCLDYLDCDAATTLSGFPLNLKIQGVRFLQRPYS